MAVVVPGVSGSGGAGLSSIKTLTSGEVPGGSVNLSGSTGGFAGAVAVVSGGSTVIIL